MNLDPKIRSGDRHTPGPWMVSILSEYFNDEYTILGDNGTTVVANVLNVPGWAEECRANADLIAVAPGLLAACRAALTLGPCDVCVEDGCDSECDCRCHEQDDRTRKQIAAAIAAADGQSM